MSAKRPKKMSETQLAKIKELHTNGLSSYAIAKQLSIPPGVARYHINRSKLQKLEHTLVSKHDNYNDPDAKNVIKQAIERLDQKKRLLQEIYDQDLKE